MKTLTVDGKGEITATPDVCKYSLLVRKKNHDYSRCYNELSDDIAKLRNQLIKTGIAAEEIKTSKYSIEAVTVYSREQKKELPDGYEGIHRVNVEIPLDKELIHTVLNAISTDCSDDLSITISFGVRNTETLTNQLIRNSVASARTNAKTISDAAGITLGQIVTIVYGRGLERFDNNFNDDYDVPTFLRNAGDSALSIVPIDIKKTDSVTVVYEIL